MAPQKRKSAGKSPGKSPAAKKAKVDPVQEHVDTIIAALDSDTGAQLPDNVVEMLKVTAKPSLSGFAEERSDLEAKFAALVGEGLQTAAQALRAGADTAAAELTEQEAAATAASATTEAAKEQVSQADAALGQAEQDENAADGAQADAEKAVNTHVKEHKDLDKTHKTYETEVATLQGALDLIQGPNSTSKDGKKVQGVLRTCNASPSVVDAIPGALGQTEGFGTIVLMEAAKVVHARQAEVQQRLANWDSYVQGIEATTANLEAKVAAAKELVVARGGAVTAAKAMLASAKASLKEAQAAESKAKKAVDTKSKAAGKAEKVKDSADGALGAFQALYTRTDVREVEANGDNGNEAAAEA